MYAAPSNPSNSRFVGLNAIYANGDSRSANGSSMVNDANGLVQAPAFNISSLQHQPIQIDHSISHSIGRQYNHGHQDHGLQKLKPVQQIQQFLNPVGNVILQKDHPIAQSAFLTGKGGTNIYGDHDNASGLSYRGAPMTLLPTIPASSLVNNGFRSPRVNQHNLATSPDKNRTWPRLSPKVEADLAWDHSPPYQNVVIERRIDVPQNGRPTYVEYGRALFQTRGDAADRTCSISNVFATSSPQTSRTIAEAEAAAILADLPNAFRQPNFENGVYPDVALHSRPVVKSTPAVRAEAAAAAAANYVRFAEMQHQQRLRPPAIQNDSLALYSFTNAGLNSDGVRNPFPVIKEEPNQFESKQHMKPALPNPKLQEFVLKQLSEKAILEKRLLEQSALLRQAQERLLRQENFGGQQQSRLYDASGQLRPDASGSTLLEHHQHHHQQLQLSPGGSTAAASFVNEFIRQLDLMANGMVQEQVEHQSNGQLLPSANRSHQFDVMRPKPVIPSSELRRYSEPRINGMVPTNQASASTSMYQKPSIPTDLGQVILSAPADWKSKHSVQNQQSFTSHLQKSAFSKLDSGPAFQQYSAVNEVAMQRTIDGKVQKQGGALDVETVQIGTTVDPLPTCPPSKQADVSLIKTEHGKFPNADSPLANMAVHHRPGSVIVQLEKAVQNVNTEISNGQGTTSPVGAKLHLINNGRVEKKSAAAIQKKLLKKLNKPLKQKVKMEKHSAANKSPIPELRMPIVKEADPLALSQIGLLSRIANNSSRVARLTKKQRRKEGRSKPTYFEKLPTMFGMAASSLSSSSGAAASETSLNTNTATVVSSDDQLRPTEPVITNGKKHVYAKIPVSKKELATPLSDRIMMPDGTLESEESLRNRLENNVTQPVHQCGCLPVDEEVEGPYYTHLAAATSVQKMRELLEDRYGEKGNSIRIEKVRFTNKEGKTPDGCPIAKWVIRRSGPEEKILCVVRQRPRHFCSTAVIAVCVVIWDGVERQQADELYAYLVDVLPKHGLATNRRCETNEKRLCACQGVNQRIGGASFSFGCSWSMYSNTCKFCKTRGDVRKFKLSPDADDRLESMLEDKCHKLADAVAPVFKRMAPACYRNQTYYSQQAQPCRLGYVPRGPFSGITACADFCAHAHKDIHNMNNGCTVVVTLTKHRGFDKPDDEQLHVLPLCLLDATDEFGSQEGQWLKTQNGALEILGAYPMNLRLRRKPLPCCKERTKQLKQRPGRPSKAKQPRLETKTPELPTLTWPNFNSQPATYLENGTLEQTQRLPSMDTFSQFSSRTQTANGLQYANGSPSFFNMDGSRPTPVSHSINAYDLAGFAQGYRTPTSSASCDFGAEGRCEEEDKSIYVAYTDNREAFADPRVGGVAIALSHGSVLLEVAKRELHATTALKTPDRRDPKRISLVFYQHKHLNYVDHGSEELEKKRAAKNALKDLDPATLVMPSDDEVEDVTKGAAKILEEKWPEVQPLKAAGEWRVVGARNLSLTFTRDSVVTASSSKMNECRPTQKYSGPLPIVPLKEAKLKK